MSNPNLQPKRIVRSDGVETTVYVNPNKNRKSNDRVISSTQMASSVTESDNGKSVVDEVIASIKNLKSVSLTYVDYRDSLDDDKDAVSMFLAGDLDGLNERVFGNYDDFDNRMESIVSYANEELREYDMDWNDLDYDEQDEIRFALEEKDDSDVLGQLIRNTGVKLVTYDIESVTDAIEKYCTDDNGNVDDEMVNRLTWGNYDNFDERTAFVKDYMGKLGFDTSSEGFDKSAHSLVANGAYDWHSGVQMGFIFTADIEDVNVGIWSEEQQRTLDEREISFSQNAFFGMIDRFNGSGMLEEFPTGNEVKITATKEKPIQLDSNTGGYGWDEIVGGSTSLNVSLKSEWK